MATIELTFGGQTGLTRGYCIGGFEWRLGVFTLDRVQAKIASGTATFNAQVTSPGDTHSGWTVDNEALGALLWHLKADDLGAPAGAPEDAEVPTWYSNCQGRDGAFAKFEATVEPEWQSDSGPGSSEAVAFDGSDSVLVMTAGTSKLVYDADLTAVAVLGEFNSGNNRPIMGTSDHNNTSWQTRWGHQGGDLKVRNDSGDTFNFNNDDLATDQIRVLTIDNGTPTVSKASEYVHGSSIYLSQDTDVDSSAGGWTLNAIGGAERERSSGFQAKVYSGSISELMLFDTFLSQTDRESIEGYLAHKYSMTGSLPAAHPYKSTNPVHTSYLGTSDLVLSSSYSILSGTGSPTMASTDSMSFFLPASQNPGDITVLLTYS